MKHQGKAFIRDESGAVTVDYVPILGSVIVLGLVIAVNVGTGSTQLGSNVSTTASNVDVAQLARGQNAEGGTPTSGTGGGADYLDPLPPSYGDDGYGDNSSGGAAGFVPGQGNSCGGPGGSCSGLGDGTNPGQGSGNYNAGDTPGGTGTDNPNNSGNTQGDLDDLGQGGSEGGSDGGSSAGTGSGASGSTGGTPGTGASSPPVEVDYVFPDLTIDHNGWATTAVSDWVDLSNVLPYKMPYTVTGPGNPTAQAVNNQQHASHNVRWGTNIRMEVPQAGESYTAILDVGNGFWTASFTVHRLHDPAALPGPGAGGQTDGLPTNPDFTIPATTIHQHHTGPVHSDWLGPNDLPFPVPANFEMSGEGDGTAQTANGHATSGQIPSWGTQFRADPPPCGTTGTSVITLDTGEVGIWQIVRPDC